MSVTSLIIPYTCKHLFQGSSNSNELEISLVDKFPQKEIEIRCNFSISGYAS